MYTLISSPFRVEKVNQLEIMFVAFTASILFMVINFILLLYFGLGMDPVFANYHYMMLFEPAKSILTLIGMDNFYLNVAANILIHSIFIFYPLVNYFKTKFIFIIFFVFIMVSIVLDLLI